MPITITITHNEADGDPLRVYLDSTPSGIRTSGQEIVPGESVQLVSDFPLRGSVAAPDGAGWTISVSNDLSVTPLMLRAESAGSDIPWTVTNAAGEARGPEGRPSVAPGESATTTVTGSAYIFMIAGNPPQPA